MKNQISGIIDKSIIFLLFIVAGFTPFIVFNQTTEFYEIPKLIFLIVAAVLLVGLWIFSWVLKGKIEITKTPLDIPFLLLAFAILVSTYFSASKLPAIYGNFPRVHGSAVSWITYIILYFVAVSNLRSLTSIKTFLYVLYGSATVTSIISLLSFANIYLPFDFARTSNFTPLGPTFSVVAFLIILLPLPLLSIAKPNKFIPASFGLILSILFGVTIALIGSTPSYVVLFVVLTMCVIFVKPYKIKSLKGNSLLFLIPIFAIIATLALAYLPMPGNLIQQLELKLPKEIQLPLSISWKISASAFRDAPYLGTGPSTYLFDFTSYKPLEFNTLEFWNFPFDTANNEFLQVLATLGALGSLAIIFICLIVIGYARKNFKSEDEGESGENHLLISGIAISAVSSLILLAIHVTTLISAITTLFILGLFMVSQRSIRENRSHISIGRRTATSSEKHFDLLPLIIFLVFLAGAGPVLFYTYNAALADYYHRQSLIQASKSGNKTYEYLQKAEKLNPYIDLYRVDMAQTNFALANAIAIQKGPSQSDPQRTLSDNDKRTIQTLISQSINEGRVAVTLSPLSSRNWEVLASIYRNINGIAQNANTFALDSYGRAIQRDPLSPALRLNVGGVYYSIKNYDLAIRFFTDAVNLKPDNANAYFNLSIALRDKGDLKNAKLVADQTVNLLSKNKESSDYKVAVALANDIAKKIESNTGLQEAERTTINPLQNTNVNISGLNNPPQVSTPSAVRENPNTALPKVSATPTPSQTR